MPRPTVYLIAQPTVKKNGRQPNLEPLAEHGDVKVLLESAEYPTFFPQRCLDLIGSRLVNFDPSRDFVAWAGGDTLAAILVGVVLADLDFESFNFLRYERGRDRDGNRTDVGARYVPVRVPLFVSGVNPLATVPHSHEGVTSDIDDAD